MHWIQTLPSKPHQGNEVELDVDVGFHNLHTLLTEWMKHFPRFPPVKLKRLYDSTTALLMMAGMRMEHARRNKTQMQHAMIFSSSMFTTFRIMLSFCPGVTHFVKISKTILKQSTEPLPKAHMAGIKV